MEILEYPRTSHRANRDTGVVIEGVELLDHPADIGFRVRARTLPELFAKSAAALVSLIVDTKSAVAHLDIHLAATGSDYESLLVNWLNEILYYTDSESIVFASLRSALWMRPGSRRLDAASTGTRQSIRRSWTLRR